MLTVACAWKFATLACTALAAALNAEFEFAALLAQVGGHAFETGEALKERPRDVLRKAADRLAKRIEREHRDWLIREFGTDPSGQVEMTGLFAAIPDVLVDALSDLPAIARADLDPQAIVSLAVTKIGRTDERFRTDASE